MYFDRNFRGSHPVKLRVPKDSLALLCIKIYFFECYVTAQSYNKYQ